MGLLKMGLLLCRYDAAKNDRPAAFMTQALASLDQLIALGPLPK
jgi:hypothetical protein